MPLLYHELSTKRGIHYRGLADHVHFLVPIWKARSSTLMSLKASAVQHLLEYFGAVHGTASKCSELMVCAALHCSIQT